MTITPFTAAELAAMQAVAGPAELQSARVQAIGGDTWDVTKSGSGDGVTAPVGSNEPAGTVTLYALRVKLSGLALALAGGRVEASHWEFRAPESALADDADSDGLWEGRTITSWADPSLRFRISSLDHLPGYLAGELEVA